MRTTLVERAGTVGAVLFGICGLAACGDDGTDPGAGSALIVVTTNVVGDIVEELVAGDAEVEVLMPPNASPHDFAPSARQAAAMREADVLVVNGLGFEAGLDDTIEAAADDGVEVLAVAELAPRHLDGGEGDAPPEEDHGHDEDHDHEEHDDHGEHHDHEGEDPHVFTDPARMAVAVAALAERLAPLVPALDTPAFRSRAAAYVGELQLLDADIEELVATVPVARRVLVTNHEVFGYFAERYGFEVLGAVIPSLSTLSEPSAGELADLAQRVADAGVPAIFVEASSPARLATALAGEGSDIAVVELFGESLGPAGSGGATYLEMMRTNAERIVAALA